MRPRPTTLLLGLAWCVAPPALGQDVLYFPDLRWDRRPINGALADLGIRPEGAFFEEEFRDLLIAREWDLVIIRRYAALSTGPMLTALEDYVDAGGALMFCVAELDEMPEYWPMLGLAGATDLELPLSDIRSPYPFRHPSVETGGLNVSNELRGPDFGDSLLPDVSAQSLDVYIHDWSPAITMTHGGRVIVNGQEWDNWGTLTGIAMATDQIRWLLGCPADLDGDGELTVFDFIEFQNRFDSGGASGFADFCYDGRLDVFDFLEFFNLFEAGC